MDSFGAHYTPEVMARLNELKIDLLLIPGGTTDILQPLDVSVNKPLKQYYKDGWITWFNDDANVVWTRTGNRQRPSYIALVSMIMNAMDKVSAEIISRAFATCGYLDPRLSVWSFFSELNNKLKAACFYSDKPATLEDLNAIFSEPDGDTITALIKSFASRSYQHHVENNTRITMNSGDTSPPRERLTRLLISTKPNTNNRDLNLADLKLHTHNTNLESPFVLFVLFPFVLAS